MISKPNILLVFSDQHRACDIGCYGNNEVSTPNYDKLADKAAVFTNCISNSPVCVPARGSLLTGLIPNRHRAITNDLPVDTSLESIATVMNKNGYHTGYIGKWHLGGIPRDKAIRKGNRLDFTEWKAYNCSHDYYGAYYYDENDVRHEVEGYEPVKQTDLAVDFIKRNTGKPWGLVLSYGPPHDPYFKVPDEYLDLYKDRELTLRKNVPEEIYEGKRKGYLSKEDISKNYKGYYAHITALDEQFGRIIKSLENTGQLDNTIIVYTSDHGDMLGSQGLTNKQLTYFESVNVPLIVYYKGKTVNVMSDEIISLVDLPVSLMSLAGMKFKSDVDGRDLSDLFLNKAAKGAELAYILDTVPCHQAYERGYPEWRGMVTSQYTYARSYDGSFCVLFDNKKDKWQINNLKDDQAVVSFLENKLKETVEKYDEFLPWDEFIKRHGYLNDWNDSQEYFKLPILE